MPASMPTQMNDAYMKVQKLNFRIPGASSTGPTLNCAGDLDAADTNYYPRLNTHEPHNGMLRVLQGRESLSICDANAAGEELALRCRRDQASGITTRTRSLGCKMERSI